MRRNRYLLIPALLLLLSLCFTLASCTTTQKSTEKQTSKNTNKIESTVTLATTTSTQDSGLLDYLIPIFEKKYNTKVKVIAVGSGQALAMGQKGDADVLLVHSPADEETFMKGGYGVNRKLVMHNQFLLVGPPADPAQVKTATDVVQAMKQIADHKATFISRGDKSGTNTKELSLWKAAGITPSGSWYVEAGQGMGDTLMMASQKSAYTLTDEATYLTMKDKLNLVVVRQGDQKLLNIYHVIEVNPSKFPKVHHKAAAAFSQFITSAEGQKLVADFGKDKFGKSLFAPDAVKTK